MRVSGMRMKGNISSTQGRAFGGQGHLSQPLLEQVGKVIVFISQTMRRGGDLPKTIQLVCAGGKMQTRVRWTQGRCSSSGLAAGPRWDTQADGKAQQDQGGKRLDMGESSVVSEECFGGTMGIEAR